MPEFVKLYRLLQLLFDELNLRVVLEQWNDEGYIFVGTNWALQLLKADFGLGQYQYTIGEQDSRFTDNLDEVRHALENR